MKQTNLGTVVSENLRRSAMKDITLTSSVTGQVARVVVYTAWNFAYLPVWQSTKLPLDSTESFIKQSIELSNKNI